MTEGILLDILRRTLHHGPGLRTAVLLKGCPLRCPWCRTPEAISPDPEVRIEARRCNECGRCFEVCPHPPGDGTPAVDRALCVRCGGCVAACPTGARQVVGRRVSARRVVREVLRDRSVLERSGGGVTFTGGEPFLQAEFLIECLRSCRKGGIRTAVETSGHAGREAVLEAARWTDLFLYELKILDDARHRAATGVSVVGILDNLRALDEGGAAVEVRFPLIPGVNDGGADLDALARLVAGLTRPPVVRLLALPRPSRELVTRLGDECEAQPLEPKALERAAARLRAGGVEVRVGR